MCDVGLQSSRAGEEPHHQVEQLPAVGTGGSVEATVRKRLLGEIVTSLGATVNANGFKGIYLLLLLSNNMYSKEVNDTHSLVWIVGGLLDDLAVDLISQQLLFLP